MKHVLHVMGGMQGGAAESTLTIINALKAKGIKSSIYLFERSSDKTPQKYLDAVYGRVEKGPLYIWVKHRKPFFSRVVGEMYYLQSTKFLYGSTGRIVKFAKQVEADVITSAAAVYPDAAIAAMRLGLPHIWHIRELFGQQHEYFPKWFWKFGFAKKIQKSGYPINNSRFTQNVLFASDTTSVVVNNAIDLESLSVLRAQYPMETNTVHTFGVVAGGVKWKRHDFVLDAAHILKKHAHQFKLLLIGIDESKAGVHSDNVLAIQQKIQDLDLADCVFIHGKEPTSTRVFEKLDVLVHAATEESFGRVYYEAGAAARPVIACDSIAARELIQNGVNGYLVDPNDPKEMASKMQFFLDRDNVILYGQQGAEVIDRNCSSEVLLNQMLEHYHKAAKRPVKAPMSFLRALWACI